MNKGRIKTIVVILLIAVMGYVVFSGNASLKEARRLTNEMKTELDSLRTISGAYVKLQKSYQKLYTDLSQTRNEIARVRQKMKTISESHTASVTLIQEKLNGLILEYDSIEMQVDADTTDINVIIF